MRTICAWCKAVLSDGDGPTSHGICVSCEASFRLQGGVTLQEFIDTFSSPILVVGSTLDPTIVNRSGAAQFGKSDVGEFSIGQVFECDNANLPGGCGRTIHCSGCAIRKTITQTTETGEPQSLIPALLTTNDSSVALHISTVKVDGCVVVKIDKSLSPFDS